MAKEAPVTAPSEIGLLCRSFCRTLFARTGGRVGEWRSSRVIGAQRSLYAPGTIQRILAFGVKAGWLVVRDVHSVALTEQGSRVFAQGKSEIPMTRTIA
jgi:hypothetical protein